ARAMPTRESATSPQPKRYRRRSPTNLQATGFDDAPATRRCRPFVSVRRTSTGGPAPMNLLFEIAWTHVTTRIRQTLVGILGVAIGVGFTIMIAGLMEGSQRDFIRQLVDTLPHVTVSDERRSASTQPAEREYAAVQVTNLPAADRRAGIKNPNTVVASIESWLPGAISPSEQTTALIHYVGGHVGVTVTGIDPRRELKVSKLASQMQQGQVDDLFRASNAIIVGEALAQKIGAQVRSTVTISVGEAHSLSATVVGIFRSGVHQIDDTQVFALLRTAQ